MSEVTDISVLASVPTREQIYAIERVFMELPQVDIPPRHHFADGIYAREVTIPAGVFMTGKIHRTQHLCIISKGDVTVWTEQGMKRLQAPFTLVSQPGTKRIAYAHSETVWTTIHGSFETDLEKLEEQLILPPENLQLGETKCLGE